MKKELQLKERVINKVNIMKSYATYTSFLTNLSLSRLLYRFLTCLLAIILLMAGVAKLIDSTGLLNTLQQISFLNNAWVIWIATLLPVLEITLAVLLFLNWKSNKVLAATLFLFTVFFIFSIYGLVTGLGGDCGCFGNWAQGSFGWGMVLRNGIFLSLSVAAMTIYYKYLRKRE